VYVYVCVCVRAGSCLHRKLLKAGMDPSDYDKIHLCVRVCHVYTYTHTHVCVCVYVCACVCGRVGVCVCVCVCACE